MFMALTCHASFELIEQPAGIAKAQTLLVIDERLIVISVDEQQRHYHIAEKSEQFKIGSTLKTLSRDVVFVDTARIGNQNVPVTISRNAVRNLYTGKKLLGIDSLYQVPVVNALPQFEAFRDLNGDGLDDFLMPTFNGYQVAIQNAKGGFFEPRTLSAEPIMDMSYNNHPWYQANSFFLADMSFDGRNDIVFWQNQSFIVYQQSPTGQFSDVPLVIDSLIPIDYDSVDGMSVRMRNEDQSDSTVRVIHGIADYNGDGITDLLIQTVSSKGVLSKSTVFALHLGSRSASKTVTFSQQPFTSVRSDGVQYDMLSRDLDLDGDLDLVVSSVQLGVGKLISALLTSSIKIELAFYLFNDEGYAKKPNATRDLVASFSLTSGEYAIPAFRVSDVNQDGYQDLLLQSDDSELTIFEGNGEDSMFNKAAQQIRLSLPKDPDFIEVTDLNADGRPDLVISVAPELGAVNGEHQVVLLLSTQPSLNPMP